MNIELTSSRVLNAVIIILASPMIVFFGLVSLWESVLSFNSKYRDRLFMNKLNLLDERHFYDFMEWNRSYLEERDI